MGRAQKEGEGNEGDITYKNTHMRKPCQLLFLFRTYFSKFLGELCFDANLPKNFTFQNSVVSCASTPTLHVPHARACVRRQGIQTIVRLLRTVPIVGINEFHPAHASTYEDGVRKELPDALCFGSLGCSALFWRRPQRGTGTGGGGQ